MLVRNHVSLNSVAPIQLILDQLPDAYASWSLRKTRSAYGGPCLRVRRTAVPTGERDFGFVASTGLVNTQKILSYCESGDGFITNIYDQTGNGRHLVRTSASKQPKIVEAGSLITNQNGDPTVRVEGSGISIAAVTASDWIFIHDGTGMTVASVTSTVSADPDTFMVFWATTLNPGAETFYDDRVSQPNNDQIRFIVREDTGPFIIAESDDNSFIAGTVNQFTAQYEDGIAGDDGIVWVNSTLETSADPISSPSSSNPAQVFTIGERAGATNPAFYFNECIPFSVRLGTSDRALLESNQQSYWGVV